MLNLSRRGVSPVIAIVLLLMMTVAAAGAAYFWLTTMQSRMQKSAGGRIEAITKSVSTRVIAQATICKVPAEDQLVAWWKFEEGSGNKTYDSSENDNTLTLHPGPEGGITTDEGMWVEGKCGKGIRFDGNDSYLSGSNDESLQMENNITVWASFKRTDVASLDGVIVSKRACHWAGEIGIPGFKFHNSNLLFAFSNGTHSIEEEWVLSTSPNEWHYAAAIWDGGLAKGYWDGELANSSDLLKGTHNINGKPVSIGSRKTGGAVFLNGTIDEIRIYNEVLSEEELKRRQVDITVYNAGVEAVPEGTWIANLKKDGNTIESDTYNASKLSPEERITLSFYFAKMCPNQEYTIELEGTQTSTTVSC